MTLLIAAAVVAALTLYAATRTGAWEERGITAKNSWPVVFTAQAVLAMLSVPYIDHVWGTGPAIAAASFVWVATLAVATDVHCYMIPRDAYYPVYAIGAVAGALNYTLEGLISFGVTFVLFVGIAYPLSALFNKGLGLSDIRLLAAAALTCSWWIGIMWILYAFIGACFLQYPFRILARPLGLGRMVPVHPDRPVPEDGHVKMRREMQFAPALVVALFAFIAYGTYTGSGACAFLTVTGTC